MRRRPADGFTLLEVLVALTIVAVAVVSLIELSAQGMRLLKLSSDHQRAIELADRIARDTEVSEEMVDTGEDAHFTWERRVALVPMPEDLQPAQTLPGREAPPLFAVSIAVRWGRGQTVELATLRAPAPASPPEPAQAEGEPGAAVPRGGEQPGVDRPGTPAPGTGTPTPGAPRTPAPRTPVPRQPGRGASQ